jgi:hypothetical protein
MVRVLGPMEHVGVNRHADVRGLDVPEVAGLGATM